MTLKVYIEPTYTVPDRAEGGIRRVTEAQVKYLPQFGVETSDLRRADLTNGHGVMLPQKQGRPFVSSCHGLYWEDYDWPSWAHEVNKLVTESLCQAQAITAPSAWVAHALTRGILRRPVVIPHGVDADEWAHDFEPTGYVLWNKARADPVSDPTPVGVLARMMPDVKFVTTIGAANENVTVTGVLPLPEMKPIIQRAGVYLATARETFGIGTLEALAAGVPVAGWRYGGQEEIIINGETGYLAEPGDYDGLATAIRRCLSERARLAENARLDARERWAWPDKIRKYAALFQEVYARWTTPRPAVSVIVTCHNLGRYLPAALDSVLRQPFTDWECLIVDDASRDETPQIAAEYARKDNRFRYLPTGENIKLSRALTLGANESQGRYIINLDADNLLPEDAFSECVRELEQNPNLHIAYGALDVINHEGAERRRNAWPEGFDWRMQMAHVNQIHSSAMQRREVPTELGGWRARLWRAEDAYYWCMATSFGFRARRVTDSPTLIYRMRPDSKGALEQKEHGGDGDWNAWLPWRLADNAQAGVRAVREKRPIPNAAIVPFGAQEIPPGREFWKVYHHQTPLISVVIPVGPKHREHVIDALDSLIAQDVNSWEAVVVNNTGEPLDYIPGAPYAKIIDSPGKQVGMARNAGARLAKGKFLYFLDADDYLRPGAFRAMLTAYKAGQASYVYTDYLEVGPDWREKLVELPDYRQTEWRAQHSINIFIARADFWRVSGFDETLSGWEDWDLFCKLAVSGLCGQRLAEPTWNYRKHTGTRRDDSLAQKDKLLEIIRQRYQAYYEGDGKTLKSCCGGNADAVLAAKQVVDRITNQENYYVVRAAGGNGGKPDDPNPPPQSGLTPKMVRMEYIGDNVGAIEFRGLENRTYRGGRNPKDRFANVHPDDVARLESMGRWKVVPRPIIVPPPPPPEPAAIQIQPLPEPVPEPEPVPAPVAVAEPPEPAKPKRGRKKKVAA